MASNTDGPPQETPKSFSSVLLRKWEIIGATSKVLILVGLIETICLIVLSSLSLSIGVGGCSVSNVNNEGVYYINQAVGQYTFSIFFLISVFDGVFSGNIFELYAAMFLAVFVVLWNVIRAVDKFNTSIYEWISLGVAGACQLVYFGISYPLYKEYRWRLYREAVLDSRSRELYLAYLKWSCFLKLDTNFGIMASFLSGRGVCNSGVNAVLDYISVIVEIIFLAIGYYFVRRELVWPTRFWFFLFPLLPAYIITFMVRHYQVSLSPEDLLYTLRILFTGAGVLSLATRVGLIYYSIVVYQNFGKGLPAIIKEKEANLLRNTEIIEEEEEDDQFDDVILAEPHEPTRNTRDSYQMYDGGTANVGVKNY